MSTTTFTPMLSLPEITLIMNNQHYHFLSQSLRDLKHHIEWHRAPHFHPYDPPSNPSSHNQLCKCHALVDISSTRTDKDQNRRRPLNDPPPSPSYDMGSRENPIYVFDDDDTYCKGCGEEGHFIGNCDREYWFDGRQYVPIPKGTYPMIKPTFVVDKDYYWQNYPRLQENGRESTTLMGH